MFTRLVDFELKSPSLCVPNVSVLLSIRNAMNANGVSARVTEANCRREDTQMSEKRSTAI